MKIEMNGFDDEQVGRLLRLLPPAPEGWVRAAQELPAARAMLDELVARAEQDAAFRLQLMADSSRRSRPPVTSPRRSSSQSCAGTSRRSNTHYSRSSRGTASVWRVTVLSLRSSRLTGQGSGQRSRP